MKRSTINGFANVGWFGSGSGHACWYLEGTEVAKYFATSKGVPVEGADERML
jgi:hypothetical protein